MPIPNPEPGLVISYAYLWHREHQAGREEGRKDRPSVIIVAGRPVDDVCRHQAGVPVGREADGATVVTVLPITHSGEPLGAPRDPAAAYDKAAAALARYEAFDLEPQAAIARGNSSRRKAAVGI